MPWRRYIIRGLAVIVVFGLAYAGWASVRLWLAWRGVERVEFDLEASREALDEIGAGGADADGGPPAGEPGDLFDAYLVAGTDGEPELDSERADVIMLFLRPRDGSASILMSIPRDLYVRDPCTGDTRRINASLDGCGEAINGAELLALTVQEFTGIEIDHFALFGFEGFVEVIDAVGGVTVCVDHAFKPYPENDVLLPAGCSEVGGFEALQWIQARTPLELIDGEWQASEDSGDSERNRRQRQLVLLLMSKLRDFRSPEALTDLVNDLSDAFVVDDGLRLGDAVSLAWRMRGLDPATIRQPNLVVQPSVTPDGEFVLLLDRPFEETLLEAYPEAAAGPGS